MLIASKIGFFKHLRPFPLVSRFCQSKKLFGSTTLHTFERNVFKPLIKKDADGKILDHDFSDDIMQWALDNEVEHVALICYPRSEVISSKQDTLLEIQLKTGTEGTRREGKILLNKKVLEKTETDGSSYPSGGLRGTHFARAYTMRDPLSEIFIRKRNKLMYVPSLLITHNGEALDDKTIFRKTQSIMKATTTRLLQRLGKNPKEILINLGLQQEFFVIPRQAYLRRPDLMFTGRTLVGKVGAKHQQFSDHYYGKIHPEIEDILNQVGNQLLQIGIPFKTKHNEVANNQFEITSIFSEAGSALDQNMIMMQILEEIFDRHGYTVLLHEKPFPDINGSGKHANWSLFYNENGKLHNLFAIPKQQEDVELFQLFILITLAALKRNNALYFASVAPPGNEVRLGGHEAPPRIISAHVGDTVGPIIDGLKPPAKKNLKEVLPFLIDDVMQEDTDRNRTSAYAYTGKKFEFRSIGSTQNAAFPMAVILATMTKEMQWVEKKLEEGISVQDIISQLREETKVVRFDGNGYSQEWGIEAKKRGLYVNESFAELLTRIDSQSAVFEEIGACSKAEMTARCQVMRDNYRITVETEVKALLNLANQKIIPRAMKYLQAIQSNGLNSQKRGIKNYAEKFIKTLDLSLVNLEKLQMQSEKNIDYKSACLLREKITTVGDQLSELCSMLEKDPSFPDLQDFLLL